MPKEWKYYNQVFGETICASEIKTFSSKEGMLNGKRFFYSKDIEKNLWIYFEGRRYFLKKQPYSWELQNKKNHTGNLVVAPLTGTIKQMEVCVGDEIEEGEKLIVLEAMKMEYAVCSPRKGIIEKIHCSLNEVMQVDSVLIELKNEKTKKN